MRAKIGAKNDQFLPYFFPRFYRCIEAKKRFLSILGQNSEKGKETGMEKKQHPSYGMIRFARSSIGGSGTALFGSSIMHNNVIRLSISKGMMEREGKDGTMVKGPTYQCYDSDEDGEIGVEDLYLKDGVEQDRTAWEKETEIYRAIKNERGL